jgi:hypothetical protein
VTVHVVALPEVTVVGLQARDDTAGGPTVGVTVTVAVVLPLSVAVRVTVCELDTVPAVAVNIAEVAVAGTVTDAGTGSAVVLFEASVTVLPPVGAGKVRVTVHVVEPPGLRLVGLQTSDETAGFGVTVTVAVVLPPSVAVWVTVCDVATEPAVAVNVVEVVVAGTVTDTGTGRAVVLFEESVTVLPPVGAA